MGSSQFCFKICDPSIADSKPFCNNIYDMTGCSFVAPASYQSDVFEACESDNMDPVGVFTGSDGKVTTYSQPAVVTSLPSVRTPASSNCVTYTSSVIYAAEATVGTNGTNTGTNSLATSTGTGIKTTTTPHSSGSNSRSTSTSTSTTSNAAGARVDLGLAIGFGPLVAVGASVLAGLGAVLVGL